MSVFAPSVASFWRQIEDYGIDAEPLFKKHGIPKSTLFDQSARISDLKIDRISAEVIEQTEDPFFGLKEEKYFLPAHIGPLGFAWLALSLIHISEPTRPPLLSRMPSSA